MEVQFCTHTQVFAVNIGKENWEVDEVLWAVDHAYEHYSKLRAIVGLVEAPFREELGE